MAQMQKPVRQAEQQKVNPPAPTQEGGAGKSPVPADSPTTPKDKLEQESRSAPQSPKTPEGLANKDGTRPHNISPGERGSNLKAEAYADAHTKRVAAEAQVYIDSESRKAEVQGEKQKSIVEKERMKEEAKAREGLKKEEQRADLVVHQAQIKADKAVEQAKEKAVMMKANAKEAADNHIAEVKAASEREKASIEEAKAKKLAEIKDHAETMIASGELSTPTHKGVTQRLKENLICH